MSFNSLDFAVFLPVVFLLYWFVCHKRIQWQNILVVIASYIFYGWWDWRFLSLMVFSTFADFYISRLISKSDSNKVKGKLLGLSLTVNLGLLGFFKYYNFFISNFDRAFSFLGVPLEIPFINVILPVGISFYTFQTLSYTIDVYRGELKASRNLVEFAAYVSFFPQLVAGPIERATHLLPQFQKRRFFDNSMAVQGMRQILWGLFKKVVIADNCAELANLIFDNYSSYSGSELVLGAIFFSFQIYGDFSGYSDIAIGVSRLFGFDLMQNFAFPYFSRDIAEFWRRWHISLNTWFRDYLYIPLGGSKGGLMSKIRNTFIIFLVSGFWHGANWTFIIWGCLNAIYFLPLLLSKRNRRNLNSISASKFLPSFREFIGILFTFSLTTFSWIFFRSESVSQALNYIEIVLSPSLFSLPIDLAKIAFVTILLLIFFLLIEWRGRDAMFAIQHLPDKMHSRIIRWLFYSFLIFMIGIYMPSTDAGFIYFQF